MEYLRGWRVVGLVGWLALPWVSRAAGQRPQDNSVDVRVLADEMTRLETELQADPSNRIAQAEELHTAVQYALAERARGQDAAALEVLERARLALPADVEVRVDLGLQAEAMHRWKRAEDILQEARKLEPRNTRALYAMARVKVDLQDFSVAETLFQQYLIIKPGDATAHYGLGRVYQMEEETEKAQREFDTSVRLRPVQTESYYQIGQMALHAGEDEKARTQFELVLARLPTHGGALAGLGILRFRERKYGKAKALLVQAVSVAPEYQPGHYYLGLTEQKLGEKVESAKELEVAMHLAEQQQGKGKPIQEY